MNTVKMLGITTSKTCWTWMPMKNLILIAIMITKKVIAAKGNGGKREEEVIIPLVVIHLLQTVQAANDLKYVLASPHKLWI